MKDISFLYSKTVTNKDNELIQDYANNLSEVERDVFSSIINDMITANIKITHNSIRLTLKIYNDTNIKTFPFIIKSACKSYSISDGSFAFILYLLNDRNSYISSCRRVKDLLLTNNKIISYSNMSWDKDIVIDMISNN